MISAIPRGPNVSPKLEFADVTDKLQINCSLYNSLPRPNIIWYINSGKYRIHSLLIKAVNLMSAPDTDKIEECLKQKHFMEGIEQRN